MVNWSVCSTAPAGPLLAAAVAFMHGYDVIRNLVVCVCVCVFECFIGEEDTET
jgi:hypothetical protein